MERGREGFKRHIKAPRIKWTGEGRNNAQKILSLNKNPKLFKDSKLIKEIKNIDSNIDKIAKKRCK